MQSLKELREKKGFICDMDGVIYHGNRLLDGAREFVEWLQKEGKPFLFLTNASERSPRELKEKLNRMGLDIPEENFYTSALATAKFLKKQTERRSAYVIGEAGLINALYEAGITMNDVDPEYVVVGETQHINYESITRAMRFVMNGAKLIGTNPDLTGPGEHGLFPACGAMISPIEVATGKKAYFIGKPNPLMMRTGLKLLGLHAQDAVMVGDRMDTDVVAGVEAGMETVLVLSGVSTRETLENFPYRPDYVLDGVGSIPGK
ncbi:MAG: TIGR01457 family HAD-type hydrolase [Christensenella sp.]|nr:TIGR01457 family HAD-type hydrolase [Christensenella sp.]